MYNRVICTLILQAVIPPNDVLDQQLQQADAVRTPCHALDKESVIRVRLTQVNGTLSSVRWKTDIWDPPDVHWRGMNTSSGTALKHPVAWDALRGLGDGLACAYVWNRIQDESGSTLSLHCRSSDESGISPLHEDAVRTAHFSFIYRSVLHDRILTL